MAENSVKRTTGSVAVKISWPAEWRQWEELSATTRNLVAKLLDEAADLVIATAKPR